MDTRITIELTSEQVDLLEETLLLHEDDPDVKDILDEVIAAHDRGVEAEDTAPKQDFGRFFPPYEQKGGRK